MNPPEIRATLDTSVVMRLLTGQPHEQAAVARDFMAETDSSGAKVFVSNLVAMEVYFACLTRDSRSNFEQYTPQVYASRMRKTRCRKAA